MNLPEHARHDPRNISPWFHPAPEFITVIETDPDKHTDAQLMDFWPAQRPTDDRCTISVNDTIELHGRPHDIAEWAADIMLVARAAERDMLAQRVEQGHVISLELGLGL